MEDAETEVLVREGFGFLLGIFTWDLWSVERGQGMRNVHFLLHALPKLNKSARNRKLCRKENSTLGPFQ